MDAEPGTAWRLELAGTGRWTRRPVRRRVLPLAVGATAYTAFGVVLLAYGSGIGVRVVGIVFLLGLWHLPWLWRRVLARRPELWVTRSHVGVGSVSVPWSQVNWISTSKVEGAPVLFVELSLTPAGAAGVARATTRWQRWLLGPETWGARPQTLAVPRGYGIGLDVLAGWLRDVHGPVSGRPWG